MDRPMQFLGMPIVVLTLLALVGCGPAGSQSQTSTSPATSRPNVLLVTIDTLRADRVGSYGYKAASTATIDALAGRGIRFETALVHAPLTGPSHASILTGQTPLGHGFRNNSGFVLTPQVRTAAEDFRQAGYRTAAFVSGFPLDRRFGFDRGFDKLRRPSAERETTGVALRMSSGSRMRRPMPCCIGWHLRIPPPDSPLPGFCGCTTTIPMRHTSRRATSPSVSSGRLTMERLRSWTCSSDA